ncbi:MAG: endonuclease III [Acidimicrobiales bacterium]
MSLSAKERQRRRAILDRLAELYPGDVRTLCALRFDGPFQLAVATILSAQCTDVTVNQVTPGLFNAYPDAASLAEADPAQVESLIYRTGFFRNKAKNIIGFAQGVRDRFGGQVPNAMDDLVSLPGIGRKTANVVRSVAFDLPGLAVDTHVMRLSRLLGLTKASDPTRIEKDLTTWLEPSETGLVSLRLILHGRAVCIARRPRCGSCELADLCPSRRLTSA